MQQAIFPMATVRVTQLANSTYSHAGSLAVDFGGINTACDEIFAPCDIVIRRVRLQANGEIYYESTEKVLCADGTVDYIHGIFIHSDNRHLSVGKVIKQGVVFAKEGGWGNGKANYYANHSHMEVGKGKFKGGYIQSKNSKGTYVIENQCKLEDVFFITAETLVMDAKGMKFVVAAEDMPQTQKAYKATVLAKSLRLRTLPQADSEAVQIDSVKKGSSFVLKQTKKNADGIQWAFLQVSGTSGGWACISDSNGTYLKVEEV